MAIVNEPILEVIMSMNLGKSTSIYANLLAMVPLDYT
jgi:hypothetical protein